MDREGGCRAGHSQSPSSSPPVRHFSRSPCHKRRYSESRSSSSSSSDSYSSRRYKRFDRFKNESRRNQEIRYERKEIYSRYDRREEKTRRGIRESYHRKGDTRGNQICDDGISKHRYPERDDIGKDSSPYASRNSYPDYSMARKYSPDKVTSPSSRGAVVKEHVTYRSPELGVSRDDTPAGDDVRYKGRVTRSRVRSSSSSSGGSSSGHSKRYDRFRGVSPKFHQRKDDRLTGGVNTEISRRSTYAESKSVKMHRSPYKASGEEERSGARVKSERLVDEKPFSGSSQYRECGRQEKLSPQYRESREQEKKSRKSSKRDSTKSSKCYKDYRDDRSDYTKSRSRLEVNDFNLNLSSPATPAILNINFNSTVKCGTHERKSAAVPRASHSDDHHHHGSHTSSRTRRGNLVETRRDYTERKSRNQEQYRPSQSDVNNYSYPEHRRGAEAGERMTRHR